MELNYEEFLSGMKKAFLDGGYNAAYKFYNSNELKTNYLNWKDKIIFNGTYEEIVAAHAKVVEEEKAENKNRKRKEQQSYLYDKLIDYAILDNDVKFMKAKPIIKEMLEGYDLYNWSLEVENIISIYYSIKAKIEN